MFPFSIDVTYTSLRSVLIVAGSVIVSTCTGAKKKHDIVLIKVKPHKKLHLSGVIFCTCAVYELVVYAAKWNPGCWCHCPPNKYHLLSLGLENPDSGFPWGQKIILGLHQNSNLLIPHCL